MRRPISAMTRNSDNDTLPTACTARSLMPSMPASVAPLRTTMPTSSAHRKSGSRMPLPRIQPCTRSAAPMQMRHTISTNSSCSLVIGRNTGFSGAGVAAAGTSPPPAAGRGATLDISRSATGPASTLPSTRPAVAAAMPSSSAPCRLRTSVKFCA